MRLIGHRDHGIRPAGAGDTREACWALALAFLAEREIDAGARVAR